MPVIKPTCVRDLKQRVNLADVVGRVVTLAQGRRRRASRGCVRSTTRRPPRSTSIRTRGSTSASAAARRGTHHVCPRDGAARVHRSGRGLGKRFGIVIEYEEGSGGPSREERSLRQEIFDLHEVAAEHFHQACSKATTPTATFIRAYWVGAAPLRAGARRRVQDRPPTPEAAASPPRCSAGNSPRTRCASAACFSSATVPCSPSAALRPRFRGRLMIPIRDHQGRVVAFTARQTDLTPEDDPAREAKYVNSPETPIFTKGNLLFNLDRARTAVGEGRPFVLVEGQLDALRCWSVGLKTAIAPQGTSITESPARPAPPLPPAGGVLLRQRQRRPESRAAFPADGAQGRIGGAFSQSSPAPANSTPTCCSSKKDSPPTMR
jgi:DNA primase